MDGYNRISLQNFNAKSRSTTHQRPPEGDTNDSIEGKPSSCRLKMITFAPSDL